MLAVRGLRRGTAALLGGTTFSNASHSKHFNTRVNAPLRRNNVFTHSLLRLLLGLVVGGAHGAQEDLVEIVKAHSRDRVASTGCPGDDAAPRVFVDDGQRAVHEDHHQRDADADVVCYVELLVVLVARQTKVLLEQKHEKKEKGAEGEAVGMHYTQLRGAVAHVAEVARQLPPVHAGGQPKHRVARARARKLFHW